MTDKSLNYTQDEYSGRGGIFGKPKPAKPIADSGRTVSYGQIIEILCSGGKYGVEGLGVDPRENILLDETPIIRQGIENFKGIQVFEKRGEPAQTPIESFNSEVVNEISVGTEIKFNNPVTRSFNNENVAAIRFRLSFILTQNIKSNGQVTGVQGNSVRFKIFIREDNGGFVERADITVTGKYSEPFEKVWFFNINQAASEFYLRVERVTGLDNDDNKRILRWESFSIISDTVLSYKRIAYAGVKFNAEDFGQSIPERKYRIKGMKLDIPSNGVVNPGDRGIDYTGNWNGFVTHSLIAPSDFFAIMWYLLLDEIDGVGEQIKPFMIDRYSLYNISKYNNELVPDGFGGFERRYKFNLYINQSTDAWKLIDNICSGCNCRRIEENGFIRFIQDRPQDIYASINNSDVVDEVFIYSSIDLKNITTAVNVSWFDLETGKQRTERVSDANLINQYGYFEKSIEAVGCTRRSQAIRFGRSVIYSDFYESDVCSFVTTENYAFIPVGSVLAITDNNELGERLGGKLLAGSTTTSLQIDYPVSLGVVSGFDENLYFHLYPDIREAVRVGIFSSALQHYQQYGQAEGRFPNGYLIYVFDGFNVYVRRIMNNPGTHTTLTLNTALPVAPSQHTSFSIYSPTASFELYKVEAKDIDTDKCTYTCKKYFPFKWDLIERGLVLGQQRSTVSPATDKPNPPANITTVYFRQSTGFKIQVNWQTSLDTNGQANLFVQRYLVTYRVGSGDFETETPVYQNNFTFDTTLAGLYEFRITAQTFAGLYSEYAYSQRVVVSGVQVVSSFITTWASGFSQGF
jgi:predicted phage tail protein